MLNIPEIDDMICRLLNPHDLTQCARVSRKWHTAVIPTLWRDLSCLDKASDEQLEAFTWAILQDYSRDKFLGGLQPGSGPSTILAKYGSLIRQLPRPHCLSRSFQPQVSSTGSFKDEIMGELTHYFFTKCPAMQVKYTCTNDWTFPMSSMELLNNIVLPRTRHLCLTSFHFLRTTDVMGLLDHCSSTLDQLTINTNIISISDEDRQEPAPIRAKQLNLVYCGDGSDPKSRFWMWLWRSCNQVEKLRAWAIDDVIDSLTESMVTHMPHLNELDYGSERTNTVRVTDTQLARLLSGSRSGWRRLRLRNTCEFGQAAMKALTSHVHTLEKLVVGNRSDVFMDSLIQLIPNCLKLHTLVITNGQLYTGERHACFKVKMLIDQDHLMKSLRPWRCEGPLKTLKMRIGGIPRPDLATNEKARKTTVNEEYSGQGREIQGQVYDRISRFINLEVLWLQDTTEYDNLFELNVDFLQSDCLEMSLESGLWKLSGLKKLKELNVSCMWTRIGIKEVQWMTDHWPQLRLIYGLQADHEREALDWLQQHRPLIRVLDKTSF